MRRCLPGARPRRPSSYASFWQLPASASTACWMSWMRVERGAEMGTTAAITAVRQSIQGGTMSNRGSNIAVPFAVLLAVLTALTPVRPAAAHVEPPTLTALHAFVGDPLWGLDTVHGTVLAVAPDEQTAQASTTKIMPCFDLDFESPTEIEHRGNPDAYPNQILTYGLLYA